MGCDLMAEKKTAYCRIAVAVVVLLSAYYAASILHADLLCNVLSALSAAAASSILIYSYLIHYKGTPSGKAVLSYSAACSSWFIADTLWTIYAALGINPASDIVIKAFYSLTNVFLGLAVILFAFYQLNKWNSVQVILDTVVISILSAMLIWIVFFQRKNTWIEFIWKDGIITGIPIAVDFLIITGLILTLYSLRRDTVPAYVFAVGLGILAFSGIDLSYYYMYTVNTYKPNSLMDIFYVAALAVIALGVLWKPLISPDRDIDDIRNIGIGRRWLFLFLFPIAAYISEGFVVNDIIHSIVAVVIYKAFSNQVQVAIRNDELYHRELDLKNVLEKRVTEQYSELLFLANHDTVTRLHNRHHFNKTLEESMKSLRPDEILAAFLIDIDRFKVINDTLGHDFGDKVLMEFSERMNKCSKNCNVLARLGGDEFALFYKGNYSNDEMVKNAENILEACRTPFIIDGRVMKVTISLGISFYPSDAMDRNTLMRNADIAMYRAKSLGYNKFVLYSAMYE